MEEMKEDFVSIKGNLGILEKNWGKNVIENTFKWLIFLNWELTRELRP